MHQNIKEYNLINSIINNRRFEETTVSKEGPQLLLENEQQLERDTEDAKRKAKIAKEAENKVLQAKIQKNESDIREDSEGDGMSKDDIKEKIAELTEKIAELRKKLDDGDEESIDEDCPHTDGHDHNEDYCAMVKSQLGKLSQMSGMIASMIPKDTDLPEGVKEKISAAMSSLSGAAAAMQSSSSNQDRPQGSSQQRPMDRRITTFNVRPVSAPSSQRMAGFSFNPPSSQNYEEYND
jgi:hypothetical protein